MDAFLLSLGVIFVAELGDKSQLLALAFATRFRALPVLTGILLATGLVHAASVLLGSALGAAIPARPVTVVAGLAFLVFAGWTLRGDRLGEGERRRLAGPAVSAGSAVLTVGVAFLVAELGDKTMLATVTLAAEGSGPAGTWAGSTLGMVAADALAIAAGRFLGRRLPDRPVRIGAAVAFTIFGVLLLVEGGLTGSNAPFAATCEESYQIVPFLNSLS